MQELKEGVVVVCPDTSKMGQQGNTKIGTIVLMIGKSLLVLDAEGYIHSCKVHEVYPPQ